MVPGSQFKSLVEQDMQDCYLRYSMSVIVARALPDARDGFKPVHRRVMYSMHKLGVVPNKGTVKSARIVGDVKVFPALELYFDYLKFLEQYFRRQYKDKPQHEGQPFYLRHQTLFCHLEEFYVRLHQALP